MPSGNSNNTAKGKEFQELACAAVSEFFGSQFHLNVPMPIGDPPKNHKFDLVSAGCRHAGKCKCYTWTESQNTPSAKMGHVNEAVFYLSFLPSDITRFVIMKRESYPKTHEYQATTAKGELAKAGVRVLSVLEPYDSTTTSGIVLESVTDAMNQIWSIEIGQVTHKNLLVNCEMRDPGTGWAYKNGGWAQFGYRNHRVYTDTCRKYQRQSHCVWLIDDDIVGGKPVHEWARTMLVEWRLTEKLGPDTIARRLTEAGVPTPSGRSAWSDSTINCLLMPERLLQFAGYGTWNKCGTDCHLCGSQIYRHGADCTKSWHIRREELESAAFECIEKHLVGDSEHLGHVVSGYNEWVDSERALYESTQANRMEEIDRLEQEIGNLTKSIAAGVDPASMKMAVNERVADIARLKAIDETDLPNKISVKELEALAAEVRQIAESRDTDRKRSAIRKYITAMEACPESRTVRVLMQPLSSLYGHWMVAPGHSEVMTTPVFITRFGFRAKEYTNTCLLEAA